MFPNNFVQQQSYNHFPIAMNQFSAPPPPPPSPLVTLSVEQYLFLDQSNRQSAHIILSLESSLASLKKDYQEKESECNAKVGAMKDTVSETLKNMEKMKQSHKEQIQCLQTDMTSKQKSELDSMKETHASTMKKLREKCEKSSDVIVNLFHKFIHFKQTKQLFNKWLQKTRETKHKREIEKQRNHSNNAIADLYHKTSQSKRSNLIFSKWLCKTREMINKKQQQQHQAQFNMLKQKKEKSDDYLQLIELEKQVESLKEDLETKEQEMGRIRLLLENDQMVQTCRTNAIVTATNLLQLNKSFEVALTKFENKMNIFDNRLEIFYNIVNIIRQKNPHTFLNDQEWFQFSNAIETTQAQGKDIDSSTRTDLKVMINHFFGDTPSIWFNTLGLFWQTMVLWDIPDKSLKKALEDAHRLAKQYSVDVLQNQKKNPDLKSSSLISPALTTPCNSTGLYSMPNPQKKATQSVRLEMLELAQKIVNCYSAIDKNQAKGSDKKDKKKHKGKK
jgi:hypothetical protein